MCSLCGRVWIKLLRLYFDAWIFAWHCPGDTDSGCYADFQDFLFSLVTGAWCRGGVPSPVPLSDPVPAALWASEVGGPLLSGEQVTTEEGATRALLGLAMTL